MNGGNNHHLNGSPLPTNGSGAAGGPGATIQGPSRQTPLTCTGHTRPVVDLDFSGLTQDGYFLLSACKDGKPMLRQGNTGDWVGTFLGHKGAVWCVSINDPATRACTGSADFTARIWNCLSGENLIEFPHDHIVRSCVFSPGQARRIATGCQDKMVRVFDLEQSNNTAALLTLKGHEKTVKRIIWESENVILTASDDKTLRKWDLRMDNTNPNRCLHERTFEDVVSDVSKQDDILTVVAGKSVFFFNDSIEQLPIKQYQLPTLLNSANLHSSKEFFIAGGDDLKMYKYNFRSGEEIENYKGHFGPIHIVRFSPDGKLYASGSEDGTIRLWQTTPGDSYGLWKGSGK
jgi:serine-threonine kinase receptor-associated protein